jgi:hypothetical protein
MENTMKSIYNFETKVDTLFNVGGSLPVLSIPSGILRCGYGKIQFWAGAFFAALGVAGCLIGKDEKHWNKVYVFGVEHIIHGALNVLVGISEVIPPLFLVWLVARIPNGFAPFVPYGQGYDHSGSFNFARV